MATLPPKLSANDLRALAERADSYRDTTVYIVRNPPGNPIPYELVTQTDTREVVLRLSTENDPVFKPRQEPFTLESTPKVTMAKFPGVGIEKADAVFTSLVAMDKFLVPYYSRHCTADEVQAMRERFASDSSVLAVCHIPDSIETELRSVGLSAVLRVTDEKAGTTVVMTPLSTFLSTPQ